MSENGKKRFIINVIFYFIIGIIILGICKYIMPALVPFIIAFLIAALLQIPAKKLSGEVPKRKKWLAILLCCVFFVLAFGLILFLGISLVKGAGDVVTSASSLYNDQIVPILGEISDRLESVTASVDASISQKIESIFQEFSQNLGQYITEFSVKAVKLVSGGATKIPGIIVKIVITVVATFFMAADFDKIINFFKGFLPKEKEESVRNIIEHVKKAIFTYIKSYVLLFILTFIELSIGFLILGIPYPMILALMIAIFDILPVLGTGGILLPWAVVLLIMGDFFLAGGLVVLYIVITIIRNTVEPKLVGKHIGLHPLATLIAMFIGLRLLGVVGMIAFPIALSVMVNLEKDGIIHLKKSEN